MIHYDGTYIWHSNYPNVKIFAQYELSNNLIQDVNHPDVVVTNITELYERISLEARG